MVVWATIEEARLYHEREQYSASAANYTKVAEVLRKLKTWSYLSDHYSACSFLELGEAMSRQERYNAAIESFNTSKRTFETAKTDIESRKADSPLEERKELNSWLAITNARSKYVLARLQLEEAKVFDSRM